MPKVLFENDDIKLVENISDYCFEVKKGKMLLDVFSTNPLLYNQKCVVEKDNWSIVNKTYSEIKDRLKLDGFEEIKVKTWDSCNILILSPVPLYQMDSVLSLLGLDKFSSCVRCFDGEFQQVIVDLNQVEKEVRL